MTWYPLDENHLRTEKDYVDLRLRLLDAVIWCSAKADLSSPKDCLRTESLHPYIFNESRHATVRDVVCARHRELVDGRKIPEFSFNTMNDEKPSEVAELWKLMPPALGSGQLLVWERDLTIDDGTGEFLTEGYLDVSDMPPWDTWVTYVSSVDDRAQTGYLVSWVPPAFVPSVGQAIENNAYGALYWLAGTRLLLTEILAEIGWLR